MAGYEEDYLNKRPQELCKMCGRCCRMSTSKVPYAKIKEMSEAGDEGAIDFLTLFEPYESVEAARKVLPEVVDNIVKSLKADGNYNEDEITFYKCRFIGDDNLCTNYDGRKTLCKHFPSSPWAVVPPDCGFEGWLFMKREETKEKVRKMKEELLELKLLKTKTKDTNVLLKIAAVEKKIQDTIDMHKSHGSENW